MQNCLLVVVQTPQQSQILTRPLGKLIAYLWPKRAANSQMLKMHLSFVGVQFLRNYGMLFCFHLQAEKFKFVFLFSVFILD